MSISNGQPVDATNSNAAWVSKTANDSKSGTLTLNHPTSGGTVTNVQQSINTNTSDIATLSTAVTSAQADIVDLQTLTGMGDGATDLNTFTGSTIPDDSTIKSALQALETEVELKEDAANKGQPNGYASLDGSGKVPIAQLPNAIMEYQGVWNASTNSPTLADGAGSIGDVYRVTVAGTQNLGSGSISYSVGDYAILNSSLVWEKADTTDAVASVNGFTGVVVITTTDISEGTNLYYTDERAQDAVGNSLVDSTNIDFTYNDAGNSITADLTTTGVSASSYGSSSQVATFTVDNKGRLSAASNTAIYTSANDAATGANATLTSPSTTVVRLTNASLTSVDMIPAGYSAQPLVIENKTTVSVVINNETGGTAANRILTGTGASLSLANNASISLVYDTTSSRWHIVGGSGSGGDVTAAANFGTDNRIIRSDGTGKGVQSSGVTIDDSDVVTGFTQLNVDNVRLDGNTVSSTDSNGNLNLSPNGTGKVVSSSSVQVQTNNGLDLFNTANTFKTTIKARSALAADYTLVLPVDDGNSSQLLQTDGSGNLSWVNPSSSGISLRWYSGDSNSPVKSVLSNGLEVYKFAQSPDEQVIYTMLKVPSTYTSGNQIFLKNGHFSSSVTSGNVLFRAESVIFKATISSTSSPTIYSSTNTQQAVSGTTNQLVTISDIDITNASGQINSVTVGAGDTLLIKLYRKTSSETSGAADDATLLIDSFQPTF